MQRGDCLPPGGFWLPGQSPSPTKPTVRALLQQLHGEEAHGLFIPCPCSSFDICWGGRKAPVTSPTCRGHCWEQEARVSGRLPTCPPALACPTPTTQEEQGAGGTEAGLEAGGSWGVRCPLPGQTCCFCPALITQVLEKSPEARTCPPSIPHHPKVFRVPFPQAAQSPFSQETGGLPGAAPSLGEGLPSPLSGEQQAWHHFWRRPGWGPSPGRHAEGPALGGLAPDCQRVRGLASSAVLACWCDRGLCGGSCFRAPLPGRWCPLLPLGEPAGRTTASPRSLGLAARHGKEPNDTDSGGTSGPEPEIGFLGSPHRVSQERAGRQPRAPGGSGLGALEGPSRGKRGFVYPVLLGTLHSHEPLAPRVGGAGGSFPCPGQESRAGPGTGEALPGAWGSGRPVPGRAGLPWEPQAGLGTPLRS